MKIKTWLIAVPIGLFFGGCASLFIFAEPSEQPATADSTLMPSGMTYRELAAFHSKGIVAREQIRAIADDAIESLRVDICEALEAGAPVADIEATLVDGFRRGGHDEVVAGKLASGFVMASTQKGRCD